jgi:hypothetical protein
LASEKARTTKKNPKGVQAAEETDLKIAKKKATIAESWAEARRQKEEWSSWEKGRREVRGSEQETAPIEWIRMEKEKS